MRIVVTLLFDQHSETAIRDLWQSLENGLSIPKIEAATRYPPHITLAVYDGVEVFPYVNALERLLAYFRSFPLRLDVLGIFPETSVLFLAPRVTKTLISLHDAVISAFDEQPVAAHLLPNQWQPHCTLANGLSEDQLGEAVKFCQQNWKPLDVECTRIGIRVVPEDTNRWYGILGRP